VAGITAGLALGFHRFSGLVAEPILTALYTLPKVTLYPLVLLVFGLGISAKVAFGVAGQGGHLSGACSGGSGVRSLAMAG